MSACSTPVTTQQHKTITLTITTSVISWDEPKEITWGNWLSDFVSQLYRRMFRVLQEGGTTQEGKTNQYRLNTENQSNLSKILNR